MNVKDKVRVVKALHYYLKIDFIGEEGIIINDYGMGFVVVKTTGLKHQVGTYIWHKDELEVIEAAPL